MIICCCSACQATLALGQKLNERCTASAHELGICILFEHVYVVQRLCVVTQAVLGSNFKTGDGELGSF